MTGEERSPGSAVGLDGLVDELERTAMRLRSGEMEGTEAAELVERCADLAGRIASELERAGREADRDEPAGRQERLL